MYILISFSEDGDSYNFFTDLDEASAAFSDAQYEATFGDSDSKVVLLKIQPGVEFGFGQYGEVYGAEVIMERDIEV
jgi:hypothetical protein